MSGCFLIDGKPGSRSLKSSKVKNRRGEGENDPGPMTETGSLMR